ncbi:sodium:calcium antiporter [Candidatus Micrarchaeota archaeon]|nr:sodium:calcium antiporter [Candidatus Micrarchaeota archaeon]
MFELAILLASFIAGFFLMIYCGGKAVKEAEALAVALNISPIIIGLVILSIGTDLPEIATSIISSIQGHGDIVVGDALGSCLLQITVVFGVIAIYSRVKSFNTTEVLFAGGGAVVALIAGLFIISDGNIQRWESIFLFLVYICIMFFLKNKLNNTVPLKKPPFKNYAIHFILISIALTGVLLGSFVVVNSIIEFSLLFGIPEYLVSFFGAAIATSLPELVIDFTAIRRGKMSLVIGDLFGSNIVDCTLALGIGPLIAPILLSVGIALTTGFYLLFATLAVIGILLWRKKLDIWTGIAFILLYLGSYLTLFFV